MFFITNPQNIPQPIHSTSATQMLPAGAICWAYDNIQGAGEFVYLQGVAATVVGDLVNYNMATGATTRNVAAAGTGLPLAAAMSANLATFWGWYQISGGMVLNAVTAAAGLVFQSGTGLVISTQAAGTQILGGARIISALASTFTKTCTTKNGSTQLFVPNFDGLFVGLAVSGTGIAGGSVIAVGVDGGPSASGTSAGSVGFVNLNNAMTADGSVTVTFTRTGNCLVSGSRVFAQGQIL